LSGSCRKSASLHCSCLAEDSGYNAVVAERHPRESRCWNLARRAEIQRLMKDGGAMTDNELVEFATEFRAGVLGGKSSRGRCAIVSWPLAGLFRSNGVDCECVEGELTDINHIWIELADGRVLDATADQFDGFPPVYLGVRASIHPPSLPRRETMWNCR